MQPVKQDQKKIQPVKIRSKDDTISEGKIKRRSNQWR